ncbi:MAG: hypothetical protein KF805_12610 [Phycisphaeraceae bacterium]|nr:hypothetical protein [Phycisphaeraceae bacterium]
MTTPTPGEVGRLILSLREIEEMVAEGSVLDHPRTIDAISTALRDAVAAERARWAAFADDKGEPRNGRWIFAQIDQQNTAAVFKPDDATGVKANEG